MKRFSKFFFKWPFRLFLFLFFLLGGLATILSFMPLPVDFIKPYLLSDLKDVIDDIDSMDLSLTRHGLGLEVQKIHFKDEKFKENISIPKAVFYFHLRSLLKGNVVPKKIALYDPVIKTTDFGSGNKEADTADITKILSNLTSIKEIFVHHLKIKTGDIDLDPLDCHLRKWGNKTILKLESIFKSNYALNAKIEGDLVKGEGIASCKLHHFPLDRLNIPGNYDISGNAQIGFENFMPKTVDLDFYDEEKAIALKAKSTYDTEKEILFLQGGQFKLNNIALSIFGHFNKSNKKGQLHLKTVHSFTAVDLMKSWPQFVAPNPREWVATNVKEGNIQSLSLDLVFNSDWIPKLKGSFDFDKLKLTYFGELPPLIHAKGNCQFSEDGFDFTVESGQIGGIYSEKSKVLIADLKKEKQFLEVKSQLSGDVANALLVANAKPLSYLEKAGLKPKEFDGKTKFDFNLKIPLLKDILLKDCDLSINAQIPNIKSPFKFLGHSLLGENLNLRISKEKLTINGTGKLENHFFKLEWTEFFDSSQRLSREAKLTGEADQSLVDFLKLKLISLDRKSPFTLNYQEDSKRNGGVADLSFDLTQQKFGIPLLNYEKQASQNLTGSMRLHFKKDALTEITHLKLSGNDAFIEGKLKFDGNTYPKGFSFSEFKLGQTNCSVFCDGQKLDLKGSALDIKGLMNQKKSEKDQTHNLVLAFDLQKLIGEENKFLKDFKGTLTFKNNYWHEAQITAKTVMDEPVDFSIRPKLDGRELFFNAENIGPICEAFDLLPFIREGKVKVIGKWLDNLPTRPLKATIDSQKVKLKKVPALVRLFSLSSITGMMNLFTDKIDTFSKVKAELSSENDLIKIHNLKGDGLSLNVALSGELNQKAESLNIKGALGSSGVIDKVIGFIPIVGQILTGKNSLGMFAVKFHIKGPTKEPKISANPLSALTPGILRDIFSSSEVK